MTICYVLKLVERLGKVALVTACINWRVGWWLWEVEKLRSGKVEKCEATAIQKPHLMMLVGLLCTILKRAKEGKGLSN